MYGQMQNPVASAAKWIFFGLFGVVIMGILLGADLTTATWLNPEIASAEAMRLEIEARHMEETYKLQEQLAQAQTEADIRAIEREQALLDAQYQHDIQALQQDIEHRDIAFKTWMTILAFMGGALSFAIVIATTVWVVATTKNAQPRPVYSQPTSTYIPPVEKKIVSVPEREPYDPWASPDYRRQQRDAAKQEERKEREEIQTLADRMRSLSNNPAQMSSAEYYKRPLAGD